MKCPKCGYLGFETGDRCKNCGYDFSLPAIAPLISAEAEFEAPFRGDLLDSQAADAWLKDLDQNPGVIPEALEAPEAAGPLTADVSPTLPALPFVVTTDDDTPLITVPSVPRTPLSVRRTPAAPRLRAVPRPRPVEPALDFYEGRHQEPGDPERVGPAGPTTGLESGTDKVAGRRLIAALIDHAILLSIDFVVLYFTVRMAGLSMSEVALLPPLPFLAFLCLVKWTYFTAFTAVGGQTIGKMATGIRVVGAGNTPVDGACAVQRTLVAVTAVLTVGLAYVPALVGTDRRALHDRIARTRVVLLPSA